MSAEGQQEHITEDVAGEAHAWEMDIVCPQNFSSDEPWRESWAEKALLQDNISVISTASDSAYGEEEDRQVACCISWPMQMKCCAKLTCDNRLSLLESLMSEATDYQWIDGRRYHGYRAGSKCCASAVRRHAIDG